MHHWFSLLDRWLFSGLFEFLNCSSLDHSVCVCVHVCGRMLFSAVCCWLNILVLVVLMQMYHNFQYPFFGHLQFPFYILFSCQFKTLSTIQLLGHFCLHNIPGTPDPAGFPSSTLSGMIIYLLTDLGHPVCTKHVPTF